jgi:hypothetical protein
MSSTTRRRKHDDQEAEVLEIDNPEPKEKKSKTKILPVGGSGAKRKKKPIMDEWGREIDADGWWVDPIERLKQGRIGEMYGNIIDLKSIIF